MKKFNFIIPICMCLLCLSCDNRNEADVNGQSLEGTQWKLAGIVDTETGDLKVLEPKDCEDCFVLSFEMDNTITGQASSNKLGGSYKIIDYKTDSIFIYCGPKTYIAEHVDGDLYIKVLNTVQSFSLQKNELRLFYNDNKNYLLFKSLNP